jgi:hypothetical protein
MRFRPGAARFLEIGVWNLFFPNNKQLYKAVLQRGLYYKMVHRPDYNRDSGGYEDELAGDVLMFLSYGPPWAHYLGGYQDRLVGPWDYPACATRHLKAWSTRTTRLGSCTCSALYRGLLHVLD